MHDYVFVRVLYGIYMNLQRDVSHLVSIIMPVVFDKEMWMKFVKGSWSVGQKMLFFMNAEWVVKNDRYNPLANKAACRPRTTTLVASHYKWRVGYNKTKYV